MISTLRKSNIFRIIGLTILVGLFFAGLAAIVKSSPGATAKYMISNYKGHNYYTDFYTIDGDCITFTIAQTDPMIMSAEGRTVTVCGQYTITERSK